MKKFYLSAIVLMMAFVFVSCNNDDDDNPAVDKRLLGTWYTNTCELWEYKKDVLVNHWKDLDNGINRRIYKIINGEETGEYEDCINNEQWWSEITINSNGVITGNNYVNELFSGTLVTSDGVMTVTDSSNGEVYQLLYKINDGILTLNIINNKTIAEKFPYKPNILTMNLDKMTEISNDSSLNESKENQNLIKKITSISQIPEDETKYIPLSITPNNDNKKIKKNVVKIQNSLNESNHKIYPVKFEVKRIDNKKENAHLNISLVVNEKSTYKEESDLKVENDFFYEWIWKFDNNDWKNVDINSENFMMEIIYKDTKNTKIFNHQIESIKLGNPIDFSFENIIKLTLTPMDEIINC